MGIKNKDRSFMEKSTESSKSNFLKKTVITSCLVVGVTVGSAYADTLEDQFPRIYHVYVDGEFVGTVDDQKKVKDFISQQINEAEESHFTDLELTIAEEVSFVPEMVFRPSYNNQEVIQKLESELSFQANAVKLEVDGELVGYLKNESAVEKALRKIKEKYVPENVLEIIEDPAYNLKENQVESDSSKILDVSIDQKVSVSKEKVDPNELLTVEQAVKMLERGTLTDKVHTIQKGEVLGQIANKYNLSIDEILELNPELDEDSILHIGDKVNVTAHEPYIDVVVVEEKIVEETIDYEVVYEKSDKLYKGETRIKQQGQEGAKKVHYKITEKNGEIVKKEVLDEKVISEPVKKIIVKGTKVAPSRGDGQFRWPTAGGTVTSHLGWRWGSYHKGIDIAGVSNRSIYAADNGVVTFAGWDGGYGKKIVINHNNGFKTIYAHLSSINVRVGQTVTKGSVIGTMGSTGNSTGVHLHFEIYKNGQLQNPLNYY